jgi:hypothetical protein
MTTTEPTAAIGKMRRAALIKKDGTEFGFHADDEIMCRTPGEIAKAAETDHA